jgi:hypothetical protein
MAKVDGLFSPSYTRRLLPPSFFFNKLFHRVLASDLISRSLFKNLLIAQAVLELFQERRTFESKLLELEDRQGYSSIYLSSHASR